MQVYLAIVSRLGYDCSIKNREITMEKITSFTIDHIKLVPGDKVKIHVAPKGGGSENMSLVKMLIPSDGLEGIKKLVLDTVFNGGGKPCPPIIVGLGIGGNLEKSALLAKEALMREIDDVNEDPITLYLPTLEKDANIKAWMIQRYQDKKKVDNIFIKF